MDSTWLAWRPGTGAPSGPVAPAPAVPVANLFYMLCYARNRLDARDLIDVAALEGTGPAELFAEVLMAGVRRLRTRGLQRRYRTRAVDTRTPRGRIELTTSITKALLPRGRVRCTIDELSSDTPFNRALKAAMRVLVRRPEVSIARRSALHRLVGALGPIADVRLDAPSLRAARADVPAGIAELLLSVCELIHLCALPAPSETGRPFLDLGASPQIFGRLFEDFIAGWMRQEQAAFQARKAQVAWDLDADRSGSTALLPTMEADVVLRSPHRRVVVECKAYRRSLATAYGVSKVRTAHLFQLLTYVDQLSRDGGPAVSGLLLYARAEADLDARWTLGGHEIRVRTLDLGRPWSEIDAALRGLVEQLAAG